MNDDTLFDGPLRFDVRPTFDPKFACTLIPYGEPPDRYGLRCELRGWEGLVPILRRQLTLAGPRAASVEIE